MKQSLIIAALVLAAAFMEGCAKSPPPQKPKEVTKSATPTHLMTEITSDEQFKKIMDDAGSNLIAFELYADWCGPCKILAPRMEKIASNHPSTRFYKVNVDKLPNVAQMFGASSIPLVVFVKDNKGVWGAVGVQEDKAYLDALAKFSPQ